MSWGRILAANHQHCLAFENWWEQGSIRLVYLRCGFVFMIPGLRTGVIGFEVL